MRLTLDETQSKKGANRSEGPCNIVGCMSSSRTAPLPPPRRDTLCSTSESHREVQSRVISVRMIPSKGHCLPSPVLKGIKCSFLMSPRTDSVLPHTAEMTKHTWHITFIITPLSRYEDILLSYPKLSVCSAPNPGHYISSNAVQYLVGSSTSSKYPCLWLSVPLVHGADFLFSVMRV